MRTSKDQSITINTKEAQALRQLAETFGKSEIAERILQDGTVTSSEMSELYDFNSDGYYDHHDTELFNMSDWNSTAPSVLALRDAVEVLKKHGLDPIAFSANIQSSDSRTTAQLIVAKRYDVSLQAMSTSSNSNTKTTTIVYELKKFDLKLPAISVTAELNTGGLDFEKALSLEVEKALLELGALPEPVMSFGPGAWDTLSKSGFQLEGTRLYDQYHPGKPFNIAGPGPGEMNKRIEFTMGPKGKIIMSCEEFDGDMATYTIDLKTGDLLE
jgi:hypothetical protein